MRLAHFVQRYPPALGGSEAYFQRLSRFLAHDAGHTVTVWTTTALDLTAFWSPSARTLPAGESFDGDVRIRRFPLWRMRGRRWLLKPLSMIPRRSWQALTMPCNPISFAMRRQVKESAEAIDAVHATAFPYAWPIICARALARRWKVPFLLTPFLHLGDPSNPADRTRQSYTSPALRAVVRSADIVFVQTQLERDAVCRCGVEPQRIIVQGLGVDPGECTGGERFAARSRFGAAPTDIIIGHLANNSVEKGTVDLVRAAEILASRGLGIQLVLAGPEMPNFQSFMAQSKPRARFMRLGPLSDRAKRDFFAALDILALPSRSDSFGLVLLEAWANGVPCVVYRAGGPAELVRHGLDGLHAPCGDVAALADQLHRLAVDADLRRSLGQSGQARVARTFSWPDKLRVVNDVLMDVAHKKRAADDESSAAHEIAIP